MITRAGIECTASTKYDITCLSITVTEGDESTSKYQAMAKLEKKVRQQKAYKNDQIQ